MKYINYYNFECRIQEMFNSHFKNTNYQVVHGLFNSVLHNLRSEKENNSINLIFCQNCKYHQHTKNDIDICIKYAKKGCYPTVKLNDYCSKAILDEKEVK